MSFIPKDVCCIVQEYYGKSYTVLPWIPRTKELFDAMHRIQLDGPINIFIQEYYNNPESENMKKIYYAPININTCEIFRDIYYKHLFKDDSLIIRNLFESVHTIDIAQNEYRNNKSRFVRYTHSLINFYYKIFYNNRILNEEAYRYLRELYEENINITDWVFWYIVNRDTNLSDILRKEYDKNPNSPTIDWNQQRYISKYDENVIYMIKHMYYNYYNLFLLHFSDSSVYGHELLKDIALDLYNKSLIPPWNSYWINICTAKHNYKNNNVVEDSIIMLEYKRDPKSSGLHWRALYANKSVNIISAEYKRDPKSFNLDWDIICSDIVYKNIVDAEYYTNSGHNLNWWILCKTECYNYIVISEYNRTRNIYNIRFHWKEICANKELSEIVIDVYNLNPEDFYRLRWKQICENPNLIHIIMQELKSKAECKDKCKAECKSEQHAKRAKIENTKLECKVKSKAEYKSEQHAKQVGNIQIKRKIKKIYWKKICSNVAAFDIIKSIYEKNPRDSRLKWEQLLETFDMTNIIRAEYKHNGNAHKFDEKILDIVNKIPKTDTTTKVELKYNNTTRLLNRREMVRLKKRINKRFDTDKFFLIQKYWHFNNRNNDIHVKNYLCAVKLEHIICHDSKKIDWYSLHLLPQIIIPNNVIEYLNNLTW